MKRYFIFAAVVVAVALIAGSLYFTQYRTGMNRATNAKATSTPGQEVTSSTLQTREAPAGQKEYANTTEHFSLFYPAELSVHEYSEAGSGRTVSFENADGSKAFQIYITPYSDNQITVSKMKADTHNTASGKPEEIVLKNGTHALIFWSDAGPLGTMRELWFMHGGNLYEVTTYKDLDVWLADIMRSWTFL